MESITDSDNNHTKRICNDFQIKNFSKYYDFYLKSNTSLLANAFQNFRKIGLKIYELVLAKKAFRNIKVKLDIGT